MMFGIKRRILNEVGDAFLNHPQFSSKVEVTNKFPFEERIQMGVVLRNTSASQVRMSADNYLADIYSHVRLIRVRNSPGTSIEWVKEDEPDITHYYTENLSGQVDPTQRLLTTTYQIMSGPGNTDFCTNVGQIYLKINGTDTYAHSVDGENKQIMLSRAPSVGDFVTIGYYRKVLADPGVYQISFLSDDSFNVSVMYEVSKEVLFNKTTGLETTVTLQRAPISENSERIYLTYPPINGSPVIDIPLVRNTDYTIDPITGVVTFLTTVTANYSMKADYYTALSDQVGPYTFKPYQEVHTAIPGVVICMARRAVLGDLQIVNVSSTREPQARIFGGHWNMALSLGIISKDSIQMEEMVDQVVNWLWGVRKNRLEFEGITLNRVEPTGETEESFIETTGDLYFESTVDIDVMSEWQKFVPYPYALRLFEVETFAMEPDLRTVIRVPTVGYEKVS